MSESFIFDFERPPIVEVVAAVSFDRLPENALVHFGLFWESKLAEAFPRVEEKAPYVPPVERFGTETLAPQVTFFQEGEFPSPRLWFLNESGDELLQLQRNWFACNWRKVEAGSSYSHWPTRRKSFRVWFGALSDYVDEAGLGTISPTQCEVTYINHILAGETWKTHSEVAKIFRSVGESQLPDLLERESTRFNLDFVILGSDGEPGGRLHVSAQPAFTVKDRTPIYVLELTARGVPLERSIEGVLSFLDRGREIINRTFAAITSDEIQREWGAR